MEFTKQLLRFKEIDGLIKKEYTGNPDNFALKMGISRSHFYRLIGILKDFGAEIAYDRKRQTFYYKEPFNINGIKNYYFV